MRAALDTVPKPANIGDPNPLTIRDVKRDGPKNVVVDVVTPDGSKVNLYVEGPTPDWALPIPDPVKDSPAGVKRFSFETRRPAAGRQARRRSAEIHAGWAGEVVRVQYEPGIGRRGRSNEADQDAGQAFDACFSCNFFVQYALHR